jgi:DeoR/GlpR family transcriptional regulator of sugar metabolism
LTVLEQQGNIRRTHGGARIITPRTDEFLFAAREMHQKEEKNAIGRYCASLIPVGQTVIIDAGSTVSCVAQYLAEKKPQIVTNNLPVANMYASSGQVEVVVSGGVIYPRLGVLVGPLSVEAFSKLHADYAIMSAGGITQEGLTNSHGLLVEIQKAMIHAANKVIFCLDHTKIGRKSITFLSTLDCIDILVTDNQAPQDQLQLLQDAGVDVQVAPSIT